MSRLAIAATAVSFLVMALCLQLAQLWLQPDAPSAALAAAYGGRAVAIYLVCAAIALVFWAFGRFRRENAVLPIVIWGGLIVLVNGIGIVAANLPVVLGRLMDRPEFRQGFRKGLIPGVRQSCIKAVEANKQAHLTADQLNAYCGCFAQRTADSLDGEEIVELMLDRGTPAPALRAKTSVLAQRCAGEVLPRSR